MLLLLRLEQGAGTPDNDPDGQHRHDDAPQTQQDGDRRGQQTGEKGLHITTSVSEFKILRFFIREHIR